MRSFRTVIDGMEVNQFSYRYRDGLAWIYVADRPDGGLRVWSDDVPGLILSSKDRNAVMNDVPIALETLAKMDGAK